MIILKDFIKFNVILIPCCHSKLNGKNYETDSKGKNKKNKNRVRLRNVKTI